MEKREIVKLENVVKIFDKKKVINDLDLSVYEGEFLTILGSSGCGKTTLLRMISGLNDVTSGTIFIDGEDVTDLDASKRKVNTIFQNFALFNHMSVYDNIAYGLRVKKVSEDKIKKEVNRMLDLVKLDGYENRFPLELSGGEKQRVAIARGLANNPKVLLLDEPLSSLDLKLKKNMQVELKRLQKKLGITFIYVTHNQEEALTMSDRILILNRGKVEQLGTPNEIYNYPNSKFVADFIGESNIFKGIIGAVYENEIDVLIDGDNIIKVKNTSDFKKNEEVYIMIRPENIKVRVNENRNNLLVTVKDSIYNGSMTRIMALLGDKEVKINVEPDKNYEPDKEINISFDMDDIRVFRR